MICELIAKFFLTVNKVNNDDIRIICTDCIENVSAYYNIENNYVPCNINEDWIV